MYTHNLFLHYRIRRLLRTKINQIDNINCGGCAIVAHALHDFILQNNPQANPQIIYIMSPHDMHKATELRNNNASSCTHVVVKLGKYYFDSRGANAMENLQARYDVNQLIEVSPELSLRCIYNSSWNSWFDRQIGIPIINETFNTNLPIKGWH